MRAAAGALRGVALVVVPDGAKPGLPLLELRFADGRAAAAAEARLRAGRPAVHVDAARLRRGVLAVNPIALAEGDLAILGDRWRCAAAMAPVRGAKPRRIAVSYRPREILTHDQRSRGRHEC